MNRWLAVGLLVVVGAFLGVLAWAVVYRFMPSKLRSTEDSDMFRRAVIAALIPLTIGAGIASTLAGIWLIRNQILPGPNRILLGPSDSPVVVNGGSVDVTSAANLATDTDGHKYHANLGSIPTTLSLDGTSLSPTAPSTIPLGTTNWVITVVFQNKTAQNNATSLKICTQSSCTADGAAISGNSVYVSDADDTFIQDSSKPHNRMHAKLTHCDYSSDPDPPCNHIDSITLEGINGYSGPYTCNNGVCTIGVHNH